MGTLKEMLDNITIEINPFDEAAPDGLLDIAESIINDVQNARAEEDFLRLVASATTARLHLTCWLERVPGIEDEIKKLSSDEKTHVN